MTGTTGILFLPTRIANLNLRKGPKCSAVDELKVAIDPKTMQKWVWLFLECIAKLADHVVSLVVPPQPCPPSSHLVASSVVATQTTDQL